ncbi:MAG: NlpC/P60 family protein, partial [Acetivibrio sp.]
YDRLGIAKVDNYLNIRKGPGEDRKILGKLPKNAGCHIYKINKDGWAKIVSGKVTGWVKAEFLITDEEAEKYAKQVATKVATIKTETLKVRFLPSLDAKVYDLVPEGEELDVSKEYLEEAYVDRFIEKRKDDEFDITEGVNLDSMKSDLDNWVCIKMDNEKAFVAKEFVEISFKLERAVAAEEVKADEAAGVSSTQASIVEYAKQFLGNAYVWGGTSLTNGTDCSGFTMRIYEHFGYSIPRTSGAQSSYTTSVNSSDVKPGDLFFYGSNGRVSHVAMYIGGGQVIHASTERTGIKISNAYYRTPIKIGRVMN